MKLPLESITVKDRRRDDYGDIAGLAASIVRDGGRASLAPRLRFRVLSRDEFTCRYCGAKAPEVPLHVDHVVPVAAGGTDADSNLVTACRDCNFGKSDTLDRLRHLWSQEDYEASMRKLTEQRDALSIVAVKLAAECEARYGVVIAIPDLPSVAS